LHLICKTKPSRLLTKMYNVYTWKSMVNSYEFQKCILKDSWISIQLQAKPSKRFYNSILGSMLKPLFGRIQMLLPYPNCCNSRARFAPPCRNIHIFLKNMFWYMLKVNIFCKILLFHTKYFLKKKLFIYYKNYFLLNLPYNYNK